MPQVVKQNGHRAEYDASKVYTSFMRALHKRPVSTTLVDAAIERIGHKAGAGRAGNQLARNRRNGDERTGQAGQSGYVRFASVYRSFQDVLEFSDAIREISHQHSPPQS